MFDSPPLIAARRFRPSGLRLALLASLALGACERGSPPALEVGTLTFTERELLGLSPTRREVLADVAGLALAQSEDSLSILLAPLKREVELRALAERLHAERVVEAHRLGEAALRELYLVDPELELEVRHIIYMAERRLPDEERAVARAKAEEALVRARAGESFPALAAQLSEEPGAAPREGLLQPGREGAWVDEFWAAARALDPGEISDVVETQYGFHVLKLEDRRIVPFAEARDRAVVKVAADFPSDSADAWVARLASEIVLEEGPSLEGHASLAGETALARWGGHTYTADDFARFLAARPVLDGGPPSPPSREEDLRPLLLESARVQFMALEALAQGLGPAIEPDRTVTLRDGRLDLQEWSAALGLAPPSEADGLSQAALQALGRTGQGAEIARTGLARWSGLLRLAYPVRTSEGG